MSDTDTRHVEDVLTLTVDQFGRPLDDPDAIRAGIPAWHPRNDGDGGDGGSGDGGDGGGSGDGGDSGSGDGGDEPDWKAEADKWKALARKHEGQAKSNADAAKRLREIEDADKTEAQKAADKAAEAEKRAAAAEGASLRLDIALDKAPEGMSIAQIRKLAKRLTGSTREELEADAEELFADFAPAKDDDDDDTSRRRSRPRERLRPGAAPSAEPDETDPEKLAAKVPRMY